MATTYQGLSLDDFLRLPEEKPALEYIDRVVTQKVAPQGQHSWLQGGLMNYVNAFAKPVQLALAFIELRATFAGASPVPDVAVFRWERIPWLPDGRVPNVFRAAPDIAVEIVSPDQSRRLQHDKCAWYVAHGVPLALLVDPDDLSVTLFHSGEEPRVLRDADVIDFAPVLPGLQLVVQDLFGWLWP
jgi:Uma2 family endonuclease